MAPVKGFFWSCFCQGLKLLSVPLGHAPVDEILGWFPQGGLERVTFTRHQSEMQRNQFWLFLQLLVVGAQ